MGFDSMECGRNPPCLLALSAGGTPICSTGARVVLLATTASSAGQVVPLPTARGQGSDTIGRGQGYAGILRLPIRPDSCSMDAERATDSGGEARGTSICAFAPHTGQCLLLSGAYWVYMANAAVGLSAMANGTLAYNTMASSGNFVADLGHFGKRTSRPSTSQP